MNTPEGILIEDGELTIHVRKASKVSVNSLRLSFFMNLLLQKSKSKSDLLKPSKMPSSQISQMFSENKFDSIQDDLLRIELQKKFGGKYQLLHKTINPYQPLSYILRNPGVPR